MDRRFAYLFIGGVSVSPCGLAFAVQGGGAPSVKTLPPVVVKTVPASGDTEVDATKVTEIRVTFSKEMKDKTWSWSEISAESALPIKAEEIKYDPDGKTCIARVKLEPGKTYVSWLNSEKFHNFKDKDGHPAVPYLLVFETKNK